VSNDSRLKVARGARLRWDKIDEKHVLLSPERGLALSPTATEIVQLCDGTLTAAGIAEKCVERYGAVARAKIEADVRAMLRELMSRGLVVEDEER
jgi:pyrroloquinoline quinone biosynthesis protein D